jgi:hypothetical protein
VQRAAASCDIPSHRNASFATASVVLFAGACASTADASRAEQSVSVWVLDDAYRIAAPSWDVRRRERQLEAYPALRELIMKACQQLPFSTSKLLVLIYRFARVRVTGENDEWHGENR